MNDKHITIFYTDGMISNHPYNTHTFMMIANNRHIIKHIKINNTPLFRGQNK